MENKTKIFIALGAVLAIGAGYGSYVFYRSKKEDDLKLEIGVVDWSNKMVPFSLYKNGKKMIDQTTVNWTKDNYGKEYGYMATNDDKNEVHGINLPNGFILTAKSLGKIKSGKIIDFGSKTIKDYTGSNAVADIAKANEAIKNIFI